MKLLTKLVYLAAAAAIASNPLASARVVGGRGEEDDRDIDPLENPWDYSLHSVSAKFDTQGDPLVTLAYLMNQERLTTNKDAGVEIQLLEFNCPENRPVNMDIIIPQSPIQTSTTRAPTGLKYVDLNLQVDTGRLNELNSNVWSENTSDDTVEYTLKFCVETHLKAKDPDINVSGPSDDRTLSAAYDMTNVEMTIQLNANLADEKVQAKGSTVATRTDEADATYDVNIFVCDKGNRYAEVRNAEQAPNSLMKICIQTVNDIVEVMGIEKLHLKQGNSIISRPIEDFDADFLTEVSFPNKNINGKNRKIAYVETQLVTQFFEGKDTPEAITITGNAVLRYTPRRRLGSIRELEDNNSALDGDVVDIAGGREFELEVAMAADSASVVWAGRLAFLSASLALLFL
mmetsp:Transcript_13915/g.24191  ORF Transcript_13915/g.24191 Transcript_13915/m.24191 type:complete len:402 (-) Transcript_13915:2106-3311(-)